MGSHRETVQRPLQHEPLCCQLLEKTDLSRSRSDRCLIVLAHLFFNKRCDNFLCLNQTSEVHVKIVDEEEDDTTSIQGKGALEIKRSCAARGRELALLVAAGADLFKALNWSRFAVNAQFEVFFAQSVNKPSLLVKNHHVGLDEFGVNTYNFILRFRRGRRLGLSLAH